MAGFREFLTGEVLTSANVNNFLMKQSVMVFADAAARTAALGAEVAEGMLTYNLDTDQLEVFDGAAFVSLASPPTAGTIVAVKSAVLTEPFAAAIASGDNTEITGLTITHSVSSATNKILAIGTLGATTMADFPMAGMAIAIDGTMQQLGDAAGSRTRVGSSSNTAGQISGTVLGMSVTALLTPGSGSKVYSIRGISTRDGANTIIINRRPGTPDADSVGNPRSASSLIIMEVVA